jgi:hypothetical protein
MDIDEKAEELEKEYLEKMEAREKLEKTMGERYEEKVKEEKASEKEDKEFKKDFRRLSLNALKSLGNTLDKTGNYLDRKEQGLSQPLHVSYEFGTSALYKIFRHWDYFIWPVRYSIDDGRFRAYKRKWYFLGWNSLSGNRAVKDVFVNANLLWADITFEFRDKSYGGEYSLFTCKGIGKSTAKKLEDKVRGKPGGPYPIATS